MKVLGVSKLKKDKEKKKKKSKCVNLKILIKQKAKVKSQTRHALKTWGWMTFNLWDKFDSVQTSVSMNYSD